MIKNTFVVEVSFKNQDLLSFNQIAGFFDHQHLYKESINVLHFLGRDKQQGKETSETSWAWSVQPHPILVRLVRGIFWLWVTARLKTVQNEKVIDL